MRADGPRNLYHGPGFHALCRKLRGRAAPPPGLSPQTTPPTPPGLRKALANVSNCVELFGPPSTPRRLDGAAMLRHRHNLTHAGARPAPHRRPPLGNTGYYKQKQGHDCVRRDGLREKQSVTSHAPRKRLQGQDVRIPAATHRGAGAVRPGPPVVGGGSRLATRVWGARRVQKDEIVVLLDRLPREVGGRAPASAQDAHAHHRGRRCGNQSFTARSTPARWRECTRRTG